MKRILMIWTVLPVFIFTGMGCSDDTLDYHNPDVRVFVKQLKSGTYNTKNDNGIVEVPLFTLKHIPQLLNYTDDLTEIPSFPLPSISSHFGGKARLGECILWIIEGIRLGHYPSLGCKLLHHDAEAYEGIYFLTNEEVLDAAVFYRLWWDAVENTGDPRSIDPLHGSNYRWW
jgi:hypothetical protein